MMRTIIENLTRQSRGFQLLTVLLEEEYSLLRKRKPQAVTTLELSVHDLMHQLVVERESLKRLLEGKRLLAFVKELRDAREAGLDIQSLGAELPQAEDGTDPQDPLDRIEILYWSVDRYEQQSSKIAERNTEMAFAMMDQSQLMIDFIQEQVVPKKQDAYSARGKYTQPKKAEARLLRGAL